MSTIDVIWPQVAYFIIIYDYIYACMIMMRAGRNDVCVCYNVGVCKYV